MMNGHKNATCILAIDHGTSGIKAAIVSTAGELFDFEFEKTPIHFLPGGGAEQDPEDWWQALEKAVGRLVRKETIDPETIAAVSVSSTFSTTVAVDSHGRQLMNAITWMDSRGAPYVKKIVSGFPSIEGYNLKMLLKWIPRTGGGPTLSGKDDIAHVLLIQNAFPDVYAATHKFLTSKDYLNHRLTGQFASSYDAMQLFWVSDIRDVNRIRYDPELIDLLGIDAAKLPPMRAATDMLGTVRPEIAARLGLRPGIPVVTGSPDHQTACIGSGAVSDYAGHLYVGTSSWVQAVVPFKKTDMFHSIASFPTAIPGKYQSVNEQDLAGGCLDFLFNNLLFSDNALSQGLPRNPFDRLDDVAGSAPPGSDRLIFLPWLNGERTPVDDTRLRGGFFNLSKTHSQKHLIRSVMEGVALNARWSLKYVEKFVGKRLDPINFIGGGAQSELWGQIFADVLDRTIRQVKHPMQANARGAAFIAAVGLGHIKFEDIPQLTRFHKTFSPEPKNRKVYDDLFDIFVRIYKQNRKLFRKLNAS